MKEGNFPFLFYFPFLMIINFYFKFLNLTYLSIIFFWLSYCFQVHFHLWNILLPRILQLKNPEEHFWRHSCRKIPNDMRPKMICLWCRNVWPEEHAKCASPSIVSAALIILVTTRMSSTTGPSLDWPFLSSWNSALFCTTWVWSHSSFQSLRQWSPP